VRHYGPKPSPMRRRTESHPESPPMPSFRVEESSRTLETKSKARERTSTAWQDGPNALVPPVRHDVALDENRIDADAARIVRRLERAGFEAYLVGGCVRDLMLGGKPKDYDICTSARPEDVRSVFRNCRIIGRRFRLAHVLFGGGKVIEVATFRKSPQQEPDPDDESAELFIRNDNVFGEAHEDALRRDFTINALFYDLDRRQVLDWCGGKADIERRSIQTIGDASVRFREDPVRMLRAIKFAARLDLGIHPDVYDALVAHREELAKAARPRLCEEILRFLRQGASARSMWLLWETGAMAVLMPELSAYLDDDEGTEGGVHRFFQRLHALDQRCTKDGPPDDTVLWTALLLDPLAEALRGSRDLVADANEFLEPFVRRLAVPRRIVDGLKRIVAIIPRILQGRAARFEGSEAMAQAMFILEIDYVARKRDPSILAKLKDGTGAVVKPRPVKRTVVTPQG
jgi:poly(A) polymerase